MDADESGEAMIRTVGVTGTGAVASAYVRALVPAGYEVKTFGLGSQQVMALTALSSDWTGKFQSTEQVLKGYRHVNPLEDLTRFQVAVPHTELDLSKAESWSPNPFNGLDAVILTAANPDPNQSLESAARNHDIDKYSIDSAIAAGIKVIIFTSSVWRTMQKLHGGSSGLIDQMKDRAPPQGVHYAEMKARSVDYLRKNAEQNPGIFFAFNDHGWYPRETMGAPIQNMDPKFMQLWVAEAEMQLYILKQLKSGGEFAEMAQNYKKHGIPLPPVPKNFIGFNVVSCNNPPDKRNRFPPGTQIPPFGYDLSESRKIESVLGYNVFDVVDNNDGSWRRIPVIGR
ncbi:hypothetical protein HYV84_03940 [Candidatus Woesearchaeota archaeon]|nr:hypothetical protein [Candidatus Woesearchaeota archaeon]